jgi:competence protein ComGC
MKINFVFENKLFHLFILNIVLLLQGLILSNVLRAQKNIKDEGCIMALNNLRSEVIELRNEGLDKDKILISLVNKIKEDEASSKAQAEAQKNEIEDLRKQLAEAKEKCAVAEANRDASEYWKNYLEKTVAELRTSKERCFEKSMGCVKKMKTSFANVGAYSNKDNFIRGDPEGVIEWISGEAEENRIAKDLAVYSQIPVRPSTPDCPVVHRTVSGAPGWSSVNSPLSGFEGGVRLKIIELSGGAPDCPVSRPRRTRRSREKHQGNVAIIHRTVWWCTGLSVEPAVAEPPELFQLKCLSHASGAVTHLNRNNPVVPQM